MLNYVKHTSLLLKTHPEFDEAWLQDCIAADPTILGLGDLVVVERERRQSKAGRLDLLLADPDEDRRFEVELMLGATDPDHVVRAIEYWDIERRRYPAYDHVAVLVAEDITSRFLNVLSLLSGSIPLVAIQLSALEVRGNVVLNFVKVLDQTDLRRDDAEETSAATTVDRTYWLQKSTDGLLALVERFAEGVRQAASATYTLNYNLQFIGFRDQHRSRSFVTFKPRKKHIVLMCRISDHDTWKPRLEEAGFETKAEGSDKLRIHVTEALARESGELLHELAQATIREYEG